MLMIVFASSLIMQDTSAAKRHIQTAKPSKMLYYYKIAVTVFENDQEERANYAKDPERYAKSVENHIQGWVYFHFYCVRVFVVTLKNRLKTKYHKLQNLIGR